MNATFPTTLLQPILPTLPKPMQCLEPLHAPVLETRAEFMRQLEALTADIKDATVTFISARCGRSKSVPLLAEFLPWLCSEALGFSNKQITKEVAVAWLHIYTALTMLDDVIDEGRLVAPTPSIIIATLLLQRGLCQACALGGTTSEQLESLNTAFTATAVAHLNPPPNFSGLWAKTAVFMGLTEVLLSITSSATVDREQMRKVTRPFGTAWQGLDDITDFEQDYRSGSSTPLLKRVAELSGQPLPPDLARDDLLLVLVGSGALREALESAGRAFAEACQHLEARPTGQQSILRKFLAAQVALLDEVISQVISGQYATISRAEQIACTEKALAVAVQQC